MSTDERESSVFLLVMPRRTLRMRVWDAWWRFIGWPIYRRRNDGPWSK